MTSGMEEVKGVQGELVDIVHWRELRTASSLRLQTKKKLVVRFVVPVSWKYLPITLDSNLTDDP
jgi:aromatic ring hydroxylase